MDDFKNYLDNLKNETSKISNNIMMDVNNIMTEFSTFLDQQKDDNGSINPDVMRVSFVDIFNIFKKIIDTNFLHYHVCIMKRDGCAKDGKLYNIIGTDICSTVEYFSSFARGMNIIEDSENEIGIVYPDVAKMGLNSKEDGVVFYAIVDFASGDGYSVKTLPCAQGESYSVEDFCICDTCTPKKEERVKILNEKYKDVNPDVSKSFLDVNGNEILTQDNNNAE